MEWPNRRAGESAPEDARRRRSAGAPDPPEHGFDVVVGVGLVTYGIVHLLIAWIAVRIAWTGRGNDSQDAALAALAQTDFGEALLWVTVFGLGALTLWQVFETIWRRVPDEARFNKAFGRLGSTFSAIAYLRSGSARRGWRWPAGPPGRAGSEEDDYRLSRRH